MRLLKIKRIKANSTFVLIVDLKNPVKQLKEALKAIMWFSRHENVRALTLLGLKIVWVRLEEK